MKVLSVKRWVELHALLKKRRAFFDIISAILIACRFLAQPVPITQSRFFGLERTCWHEVKQDLSPTRNMDWRSRGSIDMLLLDLWHARWLHVASDINQYSHRVV